MKQLLTASLFVVILILAVVPLARPYQVAGHSAYVDLARAEAFHVAILGGDLTPRWISDFYFRLGSPIFNFYAPLAYYVIEFFRIATDDGMWALKLAYLLFWILAAVGMYRFAYVAIDPDGAIAAAAAYAVAPYLLVDVYVRAGIAEFAAFAFLPLVLLWIFRTVRGDSAAAPTLGAFAYAALILSHNIMAMVASPFLLVLAVLAARNARFAWRGLFTLGLGAGMSAFFWLPALLEMKYVQAQPSLTGGFFSFDHHFLEPAQLFVRRWGFGSSIQGADDNIGFMYGEFLWLAVLAGPILTLLPSVRRRMTLLRLPLFFAAAAIVCLLMTQAISRPLWTHLPLLPYVQFPWRFLLPATVFGAPLLALLPAVMPDRVRLYLAWTIALGAAAASVPFLQARYVFQDTQANAFAFADGESAPYARMDRRLIRPDHFLNIENIRNLGVTSTAQDDYLPIDVTIRPTARPENAAEPGGNLIEVLNSRWGYPYMLAEVQAGVQEDVIFNQFYFPGWKARVDGVSTPLGSEPGTGRMVVTVSPGQHLVEVRLENTIVRLLAKMIAGLAVLILVAWHFLFLRYEA